MSYIGNEPIVSATRTITEITATAGQTVFVANGGYTVGYLDVFVNGAQLQTSDFTATDGTSVTLSSAATAGDDVRLVAWGKFNVASVNGSSIVDGSVTAAKLADNYGDTKNPYASKTAKYILAAPNAADGVPTFRALVASDIPTLNQDTTGNAATATYSNGANGHWTSVAYAGSQTGNTSAVEIRNNGGTGDTNLANITFHCQGTYGTSLHLRSDGVFGLGGWSASNWRWYVEMANGNMTAAGNVTAYSDPRLKENIRKIESSLDKVCQMDGVRFTWKQGIEHTQCKAGKEDIGVLADQVEAVFPEIVSNGIEIDGQQYKTVAYDKLVPVLIEAIKELKAEVDELKKGS